MLLEDESYGRLFGIIVFDCYYILPNPVSPPPTPSLPQLHHRTGFPGSMHLRLTSLIWQQLINNERDPDNWALIGWTGPSINHLLCVPLPSHRLGDIRAQYILRFGHPNRNGIVREAPFLELGAYTSSLCLQQT